MGNRENLIFQGIVIGSNAVYELRDDEEIIVAENAVAKNTAIGDVALPSAGPTDGVAPRSSKSSQQKFIAPVTKLTGSRPKKQRARETGLRLPNLPCNRWLNLVRPFLARMVRPFIRKTAAARIRMSDKLYWCGTNLPPTKTGGLKFSCTYSVRMC